MRDESELKQLVESGKRLRESMNDVSQTPEELGHKALELLLLCCPRSGGLAEEAMERLAVHARKSIAEIAETNGHETNGEHDAKDVVGTVENPK